MEESKREYGKTCSECGSYTRPAWETKAHEVISKLCYTAWDEANQYRPGIGRPKKSRPYTPPELARQLTIALGIRDESERESEVKALLLHHNYLTLANASELRSKHER
jgi:hypothetical protein